MSTRKVQLCCGGNRLEGWENYDADMDITKPLPFADNSIDEFFVEHGVEHVNSHEALRLFQEFFRCLRPGGVARVCVPHLGNLIDRQHARDLILGHGHQMIWCNCSLRRALWAAGFELSKTSFTGRKSTDGHWKVIGDHKDEIETIRCEAVK